MAITYTPIATTTLGSNQASVTFSSIPSTYTDLVLISNTISVNAGGDDIVVAFNSDNGGNYTRIYMYGSGSSVGVGINISTVGYGLGAASNVTPLPNKMEILNYATSGVYKTYLINSGGIGYANMAIGAWLNTSTINSITIRGANYNLATGSNYTIYGIKAA